MAVGPITWIAPRPSGVRIAKFRHNGQAVEMSASVAAQNEWSGEVDSLGWIVDRDAWAQQQGQIIADRMDFAASPAGLRATAQEEFDQQQDDIDQATVRRAELLAEHPGLE